MAAPTRHRPTVAAACLAVLTFALGLVAGPARASSPYLFTPSDEVREASPTFRYANMSDDEAYAELDRRGVPYAKEGKVDGVRAPVRLTGDLHGVHVHSSLPEEQRADSLFEILDARLALSLDDFCELLSRHDIVELVHYTMYRPNGPRPDEHEVSSRASGESSAGKRSSRKRSAGKRGSGKRSTGKRSATTGSKAKGLGKGTRSSKQRTSKRSSGKKQKVGGSKPKSKGKPASKKSTTSTAKPATRSHGARRPASRPSARASSGSKRRGRRAEMREVKKQTYAPPGTRHPAGLAIDVGGLRKRDGRWLSVAHHFDGHIGARTCGATATPPKSAEGRELWSIVCEAADLGLFTYVLTPNFDKWHADHLHMEIRGDVRWFLYH